MINFGNSFLFSKEIIILKLADKQIVRSVANKNQNQQAASDSKPSLIIQETVHFFPEGASLVENVGSIIALKSTDSDGEAIGITGEIIDQVGEVLTSFEGKSGSWIFTLLPQSGKIISQKELLVMVKPLIRFCKMLYKKATVLECQKKTAY